jgi:hypothetical protein
MISLVIFDNSISFNTTALTFDFELIRLFGVLLEVDEDCCDEEEKQNSNCSTCYARRFHMRISSCYVKKKK